MTMKTVSEIAGRIHFLERIKDEYLRKKQYKQASELTRILKELYWVLGVKI